MHTFVNEGALRIFRNETVAIAEKFQDIHECGITEVEIMLLTPELARVAKLAVQKHLEEVDHIVIDNKVE